MTREQMIQHLVTVSAQWGITTSTGQPFTAEIFGRASDEWLKKQIKRLNREGRKLAQQ